MMPEVMQKAEEFLKFLDAEDLDTSTPAEIQFTFLTFVEAANAMAQSIKDRHFSTKDLLVFKSTGNTYHLGHVTDTECRPDYTAAFQSHWGEKSTTLWPCMRLVGEAASKRKTPKGQLGQAISYLHYLLLARPDLHVAQGVYTSASEVTFLFGIGGFGVRSFVVPWTSEDLHRLAYAFFYRVYDPGRFSDTLYIRMDPDLERNIVAYTVQLTETTGDDSIQRAVLPNLLPLYASSPFGTRTHIFSNPEFPVNVNGKPLAVLKDQLCRHETRFDEYGILNRIHEPGMVPGVIEVVYHESLEASFCTSRRKLRIGLRHVGKPFMSIPTPQQMLEIVFDILEVLRYLRFERRVLHRDISIGNIMYFEDDPASLTGATSDAKSGGFNETVGPKEVPLCFIKYLLGEGNDPRKTSALLIDFNHAEDLKNNQESDCQQTTRTGMPVFIARAIEHGGPMPLPDRLCLIPEVPSAPDPYASHHPDRIQQFPFAPNCIPEMSSTDNIQWRHKLDHDTESVFWLILYWAVAVQPKEGPQEAINALIWAGLMGPVESRSMLLGSLSSLQNATHSVYRPLGSLLNKLAAILVVDRRWLRSSDTRNHPGYATEAFQRLILQFILNHRHEKFMKTEVHHKLRQPEKIPQNPSTPNWMEHDYIRSRLSLSPSSP